MSFLRTFRGLVNFVHLFFSSCHLSIAIHSSTLPGSEVVRETVEWVTHGCMLSKAFWLMPLLLFEASLRLRLFLESRPSPTVGSNP
jgi:hypothetical protein